MTRKRMRAAHRVLPACLAVAAATLTPAAARAQSTCAAPAASAPAIAPALFAGEDRRAVGVRWDLGAATARCTDAVDYTASARTTGAAATHHAANAEPMRASLAAGVFRSWYRPGTAPENPDEPPTGGLYLGSLSLAVAADAEADQRFREAQASLGADAIYTLSRTDALWPLVPSVRARWAAVRPLESAVREAASLPLDWQQRAELNLVWHVPLFRTPLTAHADLRLWRDGSVPAAVEAADLHRGAFLSAALGYAVDWYGARIGIPELFVRWSGGDVPVGAPTRSTWMLGVVTTPGR